LVLLCFTSFSFAQLTDLPAMLIETKDAINTISWQCQFDGVKSIAIQRSTDSVRNFVTIGVVNKPKKGVGSFHDTKPVSGKNYYRLSINFAGDLEWFSNTYKVFLDSATIARSIEKAIQSGTSNSILPTTDNTSKGTDKTPVIDPIFRYTPSTRVFTNPYSGHINVSLDNTVGKRYSLKFFTPEKEEVLKVGRILKKFIVVDKNNFNSTGTYQFELYDGSELVESGYVTIY
jgi:hypothetical protein